jgi:dTDP-4-amino-4,6-dideoxygalactose transaminase
MRVVHRNPIALEGGPPVRSPESFLRFGAPAIGEAEIAGVTDCLRRGWLGTGPRVLELERAFAAYKGAAHAVAVQSCTAALHLSLLALGIGPGDEVITTPMTFCATVNALVHAGATPVLADVDPVTLNLSPARVAERITSRTRAVLPVHFAGRLCDMEALVAIAHAHDLLVIEDCAHAIETSRNGRSAGLFGDVACFSFYVTKNMTSGEGGMILTRHPHLAERLKCLALHGLSRDAWRRFSDSGYRHYDVVELGYKYNMMDLQAAIALPQLAALDERWQRRRQIWRRYQEAFAGLPCALPADPEPGERHAFHLYSPLIERQFPRSRDWVLQALTAENVGAGVHYRSLADHPYYQRSFGWKREDYPVASDAGDQTISLPLSAALSDDDVADVIQAFTRVMQG